MALAHSGFSAGRRMYPVFNFRRSPKQWAGNPAMASSWENRQRISCGAKPYKPEIDPNPLDL
ncbi:hypothetical protein GCM10007927_25950 [Sulfitobacter pacificus]|uniref:Uncharacterized protein n=1 Tax=Sulfitobacter pacificus TaxID=1499314 RepID=A0ABQ5VL85_9RHOB|nr:hypothetical protein GCM10007927_25950 [Sulfitobacter pacificus]